MKEAIRKEIGTLANECPTKRAALLPALWKAYEAEGWLSHETMDEIAELLETTLAEVSEVASFYSMLSRKQIGKHHIKVCVGICCNLRGSRDIVRYLVSSLGIKVGETTGNKRFHLSTVECLGSCGTAPMMQIDDEYYDDLTKENVDEILLSLK